MFKPFFVDCSGKKHIFPDDRALKRSHGGGVKTSSVSSIA